MQLSSGDVRMLFSSRSRTPVNYDIYVSSPGKWWARMLTDVQVGLLLLLGPIIEITHIV